MQNEVNQNQNEQLNAQDELVVRREKLNALVESGQNPFEQTVFNKTHLAADIISGFESFLENDTVSVAGRLMSRRIMGKASFAHILDQSGQIQVYFKSDTLAGEYEQFKKFDIGDIIGVVGTVFKTHKGEISVNARSIVLLSKALLPLPEKWHGLKDNDLRYRNRYLDLIANREVMDTFVARSKVVKAIRDYLDSINYLEVETPVLSVVAGGAAARPFVTHHNTLDLDMYLRIAPELYLKRLIVGGFERIYEIGRVFRNEGMSVKHNPEFTILELYCAYSDVFGMIELTENIYAAALGALNLSGKIDYQGTEIDMSFPWRRLSMCDAVREYANIDFSADLDSIREQAKRANIEISPNATWGKALYEVFDRVVEPQLIQPTFIVDYPVEESPLAKKKPQDKRLTDRFELFIYGREMGNAYSELNDPIDQAERFALQAKLRQAGNDEAFMNDDDFVNALSHGMPPTGGLGLGIDRMIMLLTNNFSIRDVILFPTMKPLKG